MGGAAEGAACVPPLALTFWYAEGQVWPRPRERTAWLGLLNPMTTPTTATITIFRASGALSVTRMLPARARVAESVSALFPAVTNEAFGIEVQFAPPGVGASSLVMWDRDYAVPNVATPFAMCRPTTTTP